MKVAYRKGTSDILVKNIDNLSLLNFINKVLSNFGGSVNDYTFMEYIETDTNVIDDRSGESKSQQERLNHTVDVKLSFDEVITKPIQTVQFDNARTIKTTIRTNGVPTNLTDKIVVAACLKPDNNIVFNTCNVMDAEHGVIEIPITDQMSAVPGRVNCEVKIYGLDSELLSTKPFFINVTKGVVDLHEIISSHEFTALNDALGKVIAIDNNFSKVYSELDTKANKNVVESEIEKINTSLETMENDYYVSPSNISAFWDSPIISSGRPGEGGFCDVTWKYGTMITNIYEPLRLSNSDYITRVNMGKDASGLKDYYVYKFEPKNYEKTIILVGGIHGSERIGTYTIARFMQMVVNEWQEYSQLSYLRHKVRIIAVPCANPWGQDNLKRKNFNGVDLNRNFDYKWASYPNLGIDSDNYKGTAPFSEIEAVYLKTIMEQYSDSVAYLDLHNYGSPAEDYIVYTPNNEPTQRDIYRKLITHLQNGSEKSVWKESVNPSAFNYACNKFGMNSCNPEFPLGNYGNTHGSEDFTRAMKWFGNIILLHCGLTSNGKVSTSCDPFSIKTVFNRSTGTEVRFNPDGAYHEFEDFQLSFDVPTTGIVILEGEITTYGTDNPTTQFFVTPKLGQANTNFEPTAINSSYWEVYSEGAERQTISFSAEIPVLPTNDDNKIVMGLYGKRTTDGTGEIRVYRYRSRVTFIPSDRANRVTMYSATNRQGQGVGAMQQFYPS